MFSAPACYARSHETSSKDEYFLKAYKKLVLSVHAPMVFKILACLVQEKNKDKVSACFSVKTYFF